MLLAGKFACTGIAFLLLAIGISGPRPTPLASVSQLSADVRRIAHPDDVIRMSKLCRTKDATTGSLMVCSVYGPEPVFVPIRRLRIFPSLASLIHRRQLNSA